jgi:hypothetical protein
VVVRDRPRTVPATVPPRILELHRRVILRRIRADIEPPVECKMDVYRSKA